MDRELTIIQITQDMNELAEQYEGAADNENLWALGAETDEAVEMHQENARHCLAMAEMYRRMAKYPEAILKLFDED